MLWMDSSLADWRNEQVLTMTASAFSASGMRVMPDFWRWPTMISLSTRFFAQPREMRLTVIMRERRGMDATEAVCDGDKKTAASQPRLEGEVVALAGLAVTAALAFFRFR